jgi:hypothetical protein
VIFCTGQMSENAIFKNTTKHKKTINCFWKCFQLNTFSDRKLLPPKQTELLCIANPKNMLNSEGRNINLPGKQRTKGKKFHFLIFFYKLWVNIKSPRNSKRIYLKKLTNSILMSYHIRTSF